MFWIGMLIGFIAGHIALAIDETLKSRGLHVWQRVVWALSIFIGVTAVGFGLIWVGGLFS